MPPIREQLAELIAAAPNAEPVYLEAESLDLSAGSDEIEAVEQEFTQKFHALLPELINVLGEPKWTLPADRSWFDGWWPETLEAAAWEVADRVVCFAVEHQDKELPVVLLIQCLTTAELDEFAA